MPRKRKPPPIDQTDALAAIAAKALADGVVKPTVIPTNTNSRNNLGVPVKPRYGKRGCRGQFYRAQKYTQKRKRS